MNEPVAAATAAQRGEALRPQAKMAQS